MKIEVCCGSYEDALASYNGGADRIELCSCLFFGGLTPSLGTFLKTRDKTNIEISVMIRPREGGFCYSENEFELMMKDVELFIKNGADSIVFGFLNKDGSIDYDRCKTMTTLVSGKAKCVFHKAYDVAIDDLIESANRLKEVGIDRILTAGKRKTAKDGADNIKKLIELDRIDILPAGNIRIHNLEELHNKTNCTWVHTSAFEKQIDNSAFNEKILFTDNVLPKQGEYKRVNSKIVSDIVKYGRML